MKINNTIKPPAQPKPTKNKKQVTFLLYPNELLLQQGTSAGIKSTTTTTKTRKVVVQHDYGILESTKPVGVGVEKMCAKTATGKYLAEIANYASVHGLNQLAAARRHTCERYLLGLVILGALAGLIGVSLDSYYRYQHESTVLVLDNNFRKFQIAKPSITICPINLLDTEKFARVLASHNIKDTERTRNFLLALSNLTYDSISSSSSSNKIDAEYNEVESKLWLRLLYELRGNVEITASQYTDEFTWQSTERGLCVLLASRVADYASIENWFLNQQHSSKNQSKKSFFNVDNYSVVGSITCKTHDYWMSMHYPDTIIDYTTVGKIIRRLTLNSLTLSINEVSCSESVAEHLTIRRRGCKLLRDGGLDTWPIYTYGMCRQECRYRKIRSLCGCLPHFAKPIENVAICNASQLLCVGKHASEMVQLKSEELKACKCLQDCNQALYIDKESTSFPLHEGSPSDAIMNLNIDFPKVMLIREELYSFTDFLASIGGAAGLFLGASVLSVCELVYFLTFRLLWYCAAEKRKQMKIKALLSTQ